MFVVDSVKLMTFAGGWKPKKPITRSHSAESAESGGLFGGRPDVLRSATGMAFAPRRSEEDA